MSSIPKITFGLESEYIVVTQQNFTPLWHKSLKFNQLNEILESIDTTSISSMLSFDDLELEAPHRKKMPFVVEGYHLPEMDSQANELLPKGVEIRTPVCQSLEQLIEVHKTLHSSLKKTFNENCLDISALSHHPIESEFTGPQNKRRYDYWQWSMEVMTTYGPDINIGLDDDTASKINLTELNQKINYYAPALAALSVCSPIVNGTLWEYLPGKIGHSYRMFKRSYIAPPIEIHPNEKNRFEFKIFDMPTSASEVKAQFACFLVLLFSKSLSGRANHQSRIYELGSVAKHGLQAEGITEKLEDFFKHSDTCLDSLGFNPNIISLYKNWFTENFSPSQKIINQVTSGFTIPEILKSRSQFELTSHAYGLNSKSKITSNNLDFLNFESKLNDKLY